VQVLGTRLPPPSSALQLPVLNSPSLGQLDNVATFAWKNSAHQVLLHSRSPHLCQVDHATTTVSPFRGELHPLENFNTKLPAAPRKLLQRSLSLPTKTSRKREKKMHTSAFPTHTLTHADSTSALPTSIRPLRTNPSAPLSVYLTSCCAEKKEKTKTKLNRQPRRLLVLAISACMHIPACMCSHGSLSIWHGHFPLSIRPSHSANNNFLNF
jgi:hypothetical protein